MSRDKSNPFRDLLLVAPSLLAVAWLVSRLQWYWNHNPELSFGWIVLMLSAYLLWEEWEKARDRVCRHHWLNVVAFVASGILLFIFQVYVMALGLMPAALWGLAAGVYGIVFANLHYSFGWIGVRKFGFGFLFLLLSMPMPSVVQGFVVNGLQTQVSQVVVEALNLIGTPAERSGSLIQLPTGAVGVDEACSGVRSLQSSVMATLFIGYICLKHWGSRIVLLALGVVVAILGNLIRAFYLSLRAARDGVDAVEKAHDMAGWTILIFTVVSVAGLAYWINKLELKWGKLLEESRGGPARDVGHESRMSP